MVKKLFLFFVFLSFVLGQFGRIQFTNAVALTFLDATVICTFAIFLAYSLHKRQLKKHFSHSLTKPFLLFLFIAILSLLFNIQRVTGGELLVSSLYIVRFFCYFGMYYVVSSFSKPEKREALNVLILSGFITVVIGFVQYFFYPNLRNLFYLGWDDHLYRLFSVFLDPNFASVLFSLLFFLLLYKFTEQKRADIKKMSFYALLAAFSALAVFLTYSRTGMITLVVGTSAFLVIKKYKRLLLFCIGLFAIILLVSSDVSVEGLNPFRTVSTQARIDSVRIAVAIFQKSPLIGVGFNTYRYTQHQLGFRPGGWERSHADAGTDNSWLLVLATTGVLGFASFFYLWYTILRLAREGMGNNKNQMGAVVFTSLVGLIVSSFFLNTLFYPFIMLWIFSLLGVMEKT